MFYLVVSNTYKYFHFHHCDALEERSVVDITIDRVYVLCLMCCIIYIKKFQEEGFRFYDLTLYPKKVLMIRKTCCGYKDGQSLCFKFYLVVLMIFRKTCCQHNNRQGFYFMFYVLYHIHKAILEGGVYVLWFTLISKEGPNDKKGLLPI